MELNSSYIPFCKKKKAKIDETAYTSSKYQCYAMWHFEKSDVHSGKGICMEVMEALLN